MAGEGSRDMKLIALILLSVGNAQNITNTRLLGDNDILNPRTLVGKFISTVVPTAIPLGASAAIYVPPVRKDPPGHIQAASIDEVRRNFISAYMPFCPAEKIAGRDCICKEAYPHVEYIEDKPTDTLVIVAVNEKFKQIVVSYKLTTSVQNWIDNFNFPMVDIAEMPRGTRLHRGFYSNFMASYVRVQDSVGALLDDFRYKDYTLFITGYSLGGGLALVSTPSWANLLRSRRDPRRIQVIAYSNPRVGNRAFADYLESLDISITRYTNDNDLVPHLPGRKQGYVHAGVEVFGAERGRGHRLHQCSQNYDEDPNCSLGTFARKSPVGHAFPMGKFIPLPPYCI
ncbi:hypothetical protein DSO57_1007953 [Entomophthora muscae]|uniref:Uncharacterized protein n=1 Tax=Entomophthora muscae TaxID=34485 RepID=A0ACC2SWI5_9FUNG|nr:hypothetical protein DSO57_1007953 [Entomophthora muscae]